MNRPLSHLCCALLFAVATASSASAQAAPANYPKYVVDAQLSILSTDGFLDPRSLALAAGGVVYVADAGNHRVLSISPAGVQTTVSFGTLRPGIATPNGIAIDPRGSLYVADTANNRIVKLPAGAANGLAIIGGPVLDQPIAVAADLNGNLAIVNAGNATITARRWGGAAFAFDTGATKLISPQAVAFDDQGLLYVADNGSATISPAVYRFTKSGVTGTNVTPAAYPLKSATAVALDAQRNLYILDGAGGQLIQVPASGAQAFLIPQSNFHAPTALALDLLGNLYVADSGRGGPATVTELAYNNPADYGSLPVGTFSAPLTFNFDFYVPTTILATGGVGGGQWGAEYYKSSGTCPSTSNPVVNSTGGTIPTSCTLQFRFKPAFVGGRPGAIEVRTSAGVAAQAVTGIGLGGELAVLTPSITTKWGSFQSPHSVAVNAAETEIYVGEPGQVFRVPATGSTPVAVNTGGVPTPSPISLAVNGAGDLFILNADPYATSPPRPFVLKVPADGSDPTVLDIPGLQTPQAIAIDPKGTLFITDQGPSTAVFPSYVGSIFRVRSNGIVSKIPYPWSYPSLITADGAGNIYFVDNGYKQMFEVFAGTNNWTSIGPEIESGSSGLYPANLAADASGTLYFYDLTYSSFDFVPPSSVYANYLPIFDPLHPIPSNGPSSMVAAPSGKLYIVAGDSLLVVDRTKGHDSVADGFLGTDITVFNVGNQDLTFTDPSRVFTESGDGAGAFSIQPLFKPGTVFPPGNYGSLQVLNLLPATGPFVTDTLHFLTNAVNTDSVLYRLSGNPAVPPK